MGKEALITLRNTYLQYVSNIANSSANVNLQFRPRHSEYESAFYSNIGLQLLNKGGGVCTPSHLLRRYNDLNDLDKWIFPGVKHMPQTPHIEQHFTGSELIRDIVIGMADGLTVPFALAAGLSGIANSTSVVITGGLAEIAAGSIAMGLGGYLAARSDAEHYANERETEQREVDMIPEVEVEEVEQVFLAYGLEKDESALVANALRQRPQAWIDFMMRFELGLKEPDPKRAPRSALTIGLSYIAGGLVPLAPYMLIPTAETALLFSVGFTLVALFIFGYVKGRFTGNRPFRSAVQTTLIGGLAAAVAFGLAKVISR
jgi:VIT1/CCC1 family predicted Fe2+/Mn2+ transporter